MKQKPQFSKVIIVVAGILFALALLHGASNYSDSTTTITEISTTGTVFLTTCVWYYKKAATENTAKIRIEHARRIAALEYVFFEKRARLMKELNLTENDIYKIKNESMIDEMGQDAFREDRDYLSNQFENNASDPEIHSV